MPVTTTYPGVYIEELPSGSHAITGVSTSVTAFLGVAKRGPINKAVRILSFADYERRFGGLDPESEMSYAVRQFFVNGGAEAFVVRIGEGARAQRTLNDGANRPALTLSALDEGRAGNDIEIVVDHNTSNPASTFNLTLRTGPASDPPNVLERFVDVSMNSNDARWVADQVNGVSRLVTVARTTAAGVLTGLGAGSSASAPLVDGGGTAIDVGTLVDDTHKALRVSVNGRPPISVELTLPLAGTTAATHRNSLCSQIQAAVQAADASVPALAAFTCAYVAANNTILMTSGATGEASSVRILPGERNDATRNLRLGAANGGAEQDAVAAIRPVPAPAPGSVTSAALAATDVASRPDATHHLLQIGLDGYGPDAVDIGPGAAAGSNLAAKLTDLANRIQTAVRALYPTNPAYSGFTATSTGTALVLASGNSGLGSRVALTASGADSLADDLKLTTTAGATNVAGVNLALVGGNEGPIPANPYGLYIGSRADREGIYALESVDLFNILCLPGVTDAGTIADAVSYCQERRAFMIVDTPSAIGGPDDMAAYAAGAGLPKHDHAAAYYPWVLIADPLKPGKQRLTAPSGIVAGTYARTDAARGIWKAPAGTDVSLLGVQAMVYKLTDAENGILNPIGINCLRQFPLYGPVSWGARTLRGADQLTDEYKYVPIRRLALYIEESLFRGSKWAVFEPNDEPLWAQLRLSLGAFMHDLFRKGAFQGTTPREAYLVKCDAETTTQLDRDRGVVNILVGFAPLKPAEFVIIQLQQLAGQSEA